MHIPCSYTVSECAARVKEEFGNIDIVIHSLANGPEVAKPLLETSRKGYLAAISASSFSMVSLPMRNPHRYSMSMSLRWVKVQLPIT